ncbi:hypothetical protein PMF13cell1_01263 [Blautia producta]|uniref:Uncharacterized protein n=1 Tax=Blautia producta TaxID=33035 RepID=A0A4P6LUI1_9FIRM|nr:hypothetical protein [Blautia producta]QBE95739.1 hypothetical protein PMF13cell1_01263 [Blautia producta]
MNGESYFAAGCVVTIISVLLFAVGKTVLFLKKKELIREFRKIYEWEENV